MSLIHEALEKLEQEKKSGWRRPVPSASTAPPLPVPLSPLPEAQKNHSGVIYALSGILVFFFLAGGVYFFTRTETPEQVTTVSVSPSQKKTVLKKTILPSFSLGNQFKLTGITQVGSEWTAIVNNQLVRKGDGINGAVVEAVDRNAVTLNSNNQIFELKLYGDSAR